ncbi:hypothetical protein Fuma_05768 [Fuerstiella marisgermanici]|uniref:Uncharacterized protein n=1 Tax=Fuerstiella marisgermanici TaxID=1891926 RepID=A0A1P8WPW8_9PLAN|nr:hypothetical protein Fuma_05768 [Fuerstiella marisgermanici]
MKFWRNRRLASALILPSEPALLRMPPLPKRAVMGTCQQNRTVVTPMGETPENSLLLSCFKPQDVSNNAVVCDVWLVDNQCFYGPLLPGLTS